MTFEEDEAVVADYEKTYHRKEARSSLPWQGWKGHTYSLIATTFPSEEFTLAELNAAAIKQGIKSLHPNNKHIEAKLRQQCQELVKEGVLKRVRPGVYRFTPNGKPATSSPAKEPAKRCSNCGGNIFISPPPVYDEQAPLECGNCGEPEQTAPAILSIDEAPFIIDSEASMEKALQKIRRANMGRRSE